MREQIEMKFDRYRLEKYYTPGISEFVKYMEGIVERLPELERKIIEQRYMCREYDYITDFEIYTVDFPMSSNTYSKVRKRAIEKLFKMISLQD